MEVYARQGDCVVERRRITGDLTPAVDLVVAGHLSAPHTVVGACEFRKDSEVTSFRVAVPTSLAHAGRHDAVPLEPGDYAVRPLRERGDGQDRAVED